MGKKDPSRKRPGSGSGSGAACSPLLLAFAGLLLVSPRPVTRAAGQCT